MAPEPPTTLDAATIEQRMTARAAEYLTRHVQPAKGQRGRGTRQTWRRRDVGRRPYATSNLLALVAEATCDPRQSTAGICALLDELKLEVLDVRGELPADVGFDDAMLRETRAQAATDPLQYQAGAHPSVGTLDALLAALHAELDAKTLAVQVTKRERERLAAAC